MVNEGHKSETKSASTSPALAVEDNLNFGVLTKFIKPFDGDKNKLTSFLRNCENALTLASSLQKNILFQYILSQLEGKAESACALKIFDNWSELKSFLKTTFGESKHRDHLFLDLQQCKQKSNESVTQYSLRIETCLARLQTDITHSTRDSTELKGRIANTEDLALHTFLLGLPCHISTILRCRNPSNLNEAINLAIQEEKLQNYLLQTQRAAEPRCKICGRTGHPERNCSMNRKRPVYNRERPVHNVTNNLSQHPSTSAAASQNPPKVCRYCKNLGHEIHECRKRQFNNSRHNHNPNSSKQVHNLSHDEDDNSIREDSYDSDSRSDLN